MKDFKFYTEARVRFCETDLQGILHHSRHFQYFEVGRVEYMRNLKLIENNDFVGPATVTIVESGAKYLATLKFDETFKIYVRISELKGASMVFEYKLVKGSDEIAAEGFTRCATINRKTFKPVRMPDIWRKKITKFEKFD